MEGEPDLPPPPADAKLFDPNLSRPISIHPESVNLSRSFNSTSTSSSIASFSSSSPPDLVRQVQAAFKRHRSYGMLKPSSTQPRRLLAPQRETNAKPHLTVNDKRGKEDILQGHTSMVSVSQFKNEVSVAEENQEDASITPPSEWGSSVNIPNNNFLPYKAQKDQQELSANSGISYAIALSDVDPVHGQLAKVKRKVHFSSEKNATSSGAEDQMVTGLCDLLSHVDLLASTEMEWDAGHRIDSSAAVSQDWQHQNFQNIEMDISMKCRGGVSSLPISKTGLQNQLHEFQNFIQNDSSNAMTQSSVAGLSCITSTSINPSGAPMISSATYSSQPHHTSSSNLGAELPRDSEAQLDMVHPLCTSSNSSREVLAHQSAMPSQAISSNATKLMDANKSPAPSTVVQSTSPKQFDISKYSSCGNISIQGNASDLKSEPPSSKQQPSEVKLENSKSEKLDGGVSGKAVSTSRRKGYDPDLFFKVNGKLYQRLGKIGSGGSSEVHKVISSDCKIYALKKIKLKGRDFATAYGFCQEIDYLNKLRGKNNIIQLIDYEVTDKTMIQEVMNGSMSIKDGKVKDEGYIYMVLEYGEIDLAHMLSQKWRELNDSDAIIDENWLRFYWQQILLAVNTIHEERIVHSDLKPANFLLVKGSLKLIDFGIAKAIMSDTTHIQRDSQVGTLSYMSPEAFMCNEPDGNGNIIKCGRPSDIWSLGCILYQMVYGRTPFSEYKTFWAKFKVITDPNHNIMYEPLSNPLLLDLMKKCLAWDGNERWRIPQLLQHPFLVPPVPPQLPNPHKSCKPVQQHIESVPNDHTSLILCSQLHNMVSNLESIMQSQDAVSSVKLRTIVGEITTIWNQLQDRLENEKDSHS